MSITIELPLDVQKKLEQKAAAAGLPIESVAVEMIAKGVNGGTSLDTLLAPIRDRFKKSGMTDDELTTIIEEARNEVWQGRKSGQKE